MPYIDVCVSFNFVPSKLNVKKLLTSWLIITSMKLSRHPQLHDKKVEFDIVFSCFNVDLPNRLKELKAFGFEKSEIAEISGCLLDLTNKIIDVDNGLWVSIEKKEMLPKRREKLLSSDTNLIEEIYWLLEDGGVTALCLLRAWRGQASSLFK